MPLEAETERERKTEASPLIDPINPSYDIRRW